VYHTRSERVLTPEFQPRQSTISQMRPESFLSRGSRLSQTPCLFYAHNLPSPQSSPSGRGDKSLLQVKCLRPRSRLTFLAIVNPVRWKMKKTLKLKRLAFTLSDRHWPKSRS